MKLHPEVEEVVRAARLTFALERVSGRPCNDDWVLRLLSVAVEAACAAQRKVDDDAHAANVRSWKMGDDKDAILERVARSIAKGE